MRSYAASGVEPVYLLTIDGQFVRGEAIVVTPPGVSLVFASIFTALQSLRALHWEYTTHPTTSSIAIAPATGSSRNQESRRMTIHVNSIGSHT